MEVKINCISILVKQLKTTYYVMPHPNQMLRSLHIREAHTLPQHRHASNLVEAARI